MQMLRSLSDQVEIIIVINASDIEKNKVRSDLGITYDQDVLRLIDIFRDFGLYVGSVVITRYARQRAAVNFSNRLEALGVKCYHHYSIPGYPADAQLIMSDQGCGKNDYVETTRPLVVVTAPGPGSGKMATCISQLYHENLRGVKAGYAKFETFPIWNLPLNHPVNLAYEAATTDLSDVNMVDPFHLEAYGKIAVNYNRDIEIFPVLNAMFEQIYGESPYKSPTDMGVNMAGFCISDDEAVRFAAQQEIIRRFFAAQISKKKGFSTEDEVDKLRILMKQAGLKPEDRPPVGPALQRAQETGGPAAAIELPDGRVVTGKSTPLLGAASAAQRPQGAGRHPPRHEAHLPRDHRAHPASEGGPPGEPQSPAPHGRNAAGPLHLRRHQPYGGDRHGTAQQLEGLRDALHRHPGRGGLEPLAKTGHPCDLRTRISDQKTIP